ncbi:hypothetical protein Agub_g11958 [Astrephomene gubernaculifera]|uniref:Ubiquinone biosynthesis monooxygenase COQ6, mitochondrial n=1 Tax=Astrephomene gubernaculifera TaxID=47775 RepID=A0AAD3DZT0_9CHLO|nr:hypothetical protein Agub_g11958 [Astrephomene gubernaculifera]
MQRLTCTILPKLGSISRNTGKATSLELGARAFCSSNISGSGTAAPSPDDSYDVAIVGGGMVGAAVAALLGASRLTQQLRVAVLDVKPQSSSYTPRPVPDLRVSTITPGSIRVLQQAGAWEAVEAGSAPFTNMQVWDSASSGHIRWDAREAGATQMGVVAENVLLQSALLAAAERSGGRIEFMWPAEVRALRLPAAGGAAGGAGTGAGGAGTGAGAGGRPHGLAELELADGRVLTCRLVVAADGAASKVRQMAGLRTWGWSYGQRGVVATVTTAEPSSTAWQRFLPTGPLALLPLRDGFSSIVWSSPPQLAQELEQLGPREFAAAINKALRDPPSSALPGSSFSSSASSLLGPLGSLAASLGAAAGGSGPGSSAFQQPPLVVEWAGGRPRSFPLQLKQAGRFVLPRLALVGDAAHAVHPLAGQGVNLGFGDARVLAEALRSAVEAGSDPGDYRMLCDSYEAPRRRSVLAMTAAMDGVKRAFEVQAAPFAALRGLGLGLINSVGPVRNGIMQYAMMGQS